MDKATLTRALTEKVNAIKSIVEKGAAATPQEMIDAGNYDTECKAIVAQIQMLGESEGLKARLAEYSGLITKEMEPAPGTKATPSGAVLIDGSGNLLDSYGDGEVPEKQWMKIITPEYKREFRNLLRAGGRFERMSGASMKVLTEGSDVDGGFLVPPDMVMRIIERKPAPRRTAANITIMNTSRDRVVMPKNTYSSATDDSSGTLYTSGVRVQWVGEVPATSSSANVTTPTFGQLEIPIFTAMMEFNITRDQIEDSAIDLTAYVESKFAEAVDMVIENTFWNGTASRQPAGILLNPGGTNQPNFVTTAGVATVTADDLKALQYQLPPQYQDKAKFSMQWTNTALAIDKLKDGDGRYLWGQGLGDSGIAQAGYDKNLLGREVVYNQFAPAGITSGTYPIAYGDLSAYYHVRRLGMSIQILDQVSAQQNQLVILARYRAGGAVAEEWAINLLKIA